MKKQLPLILLLVTIFTQSFSNLFAQKAYIPDDNFEQALIDLEYDDVLDDSVLVDNIKNVSELNVSNKGIKDLTGIKNFTNLYTLDCSRNSIKFLDVSNMVNLRYLTCNTNGMNKIKLDGLTSLSELFCFANNLKVLNLKDSKYLFKLFCQHNQITSLTLNNLAFLNCSYNKLTYLNLSIVSTFGTNVGSLGNNDLACITVAYPDLAWSADGWFSKAVNATYSTDCPNAPLTDIKDSNFEQVLIDLGYDDILDGKVFTDVIKDITTLDLSGNSAITNFAGIEAFKALTTLNLSGTTANTINLNGKTDADILYADTEDEISNALTNLTYLNVSNSNLTQLDLRGLTGLKTGTMLATNNANLSCILVDNEVEVANFNLWEKDANTKYGVTCNVPTNVNEVNTNTFKIYPNPSNGEFTIEINEDALINIYDTTGKLIMNKQVNAGNQMIKIDSAKNLYYIQIVSKSGVKTQKVIIN